MTVDEIVHEALIAPRDALVPMPDTRWLTRDGWSQIITPSLAQGGMNEVIHAALSTEEADRIIAETCAEYGRLGIRFRWTVGPASKPADLADRLERAGLRRTWAKVMYADPSALAIAPPAEMPTRGRIVVERIAPGDDAGADEFSAVMAEGFAMPSVEPLRPVTRAQLADPTGRHELYLVRESGRAAAAGGLVLLARSAHLLGGVALPEARGRGLYRALVAARLFRAAETGRSLVTTLAREETSAPILAHLGFSEAARLPVFTND